MLSSRRAIVVWAAFAFSALPFACSLGPKQDDPAGGTMATPGTDSGTFGDTALINSDDDAAVDASKTNGPEAGGDTSVVVDETGSANDANDANEGADADDANEDADATDDAADDGTDVDATANDAASDAAAADDAETDADAGGD